MELSKRKQEEVKSAIQSQTEIYRSQQIHKKSQSQNNVLDSSKVNESQDFLKQSALPSSELEKIMKEI